jgi:hypothetical protein
MNSQKEEPKKHFTVTPSVVVFKCKDYPVALLVLHYVLIRRKIYPKFRIADMAKNLNKDERTIRAAVKVLRKLELLVLKGKIGSQYYEFNESKYAAYLLINPFESGDAPSQKMGVVPSQKLGGVGTAKNEGRPLSKSEGVKSKGIEERESKKTDPALSLGSQTPSITASAPEPPRNLAEEFENFFCDGSQPPSTAVAPVPSKSLAEEFDSMFDGTPLASTPVAVPVPNIQFAYGNSNGGDKPEPDDGLGCPGAPVIRVSQHGNPNAEAPPGSMDQPEASAELACADAKPSPSPTGLNSTPQE